MVDRILVTPLGVPPRCAVPGCRGGKLGYACWWVPAWNAYRCEEHKDVHPDDVWVYDPDLYR